MKIRTAFLKRAALMLGAVILPASLTLTAASDAPEDGQSKANHRLPSWCATCSEACSETPAERFKLQQNSAPGPGVLSSGLWNPEDEPVTVDILVLYSNNALAAEGDENRLRRRILEAVEATNFRMTNSHAGVRLHPVWIGPLNYTDSGNILLDRFNLQNDSRVNALRNDYKADLVFLIIENENFGYGGVAFVPPAGGNPSLGFCVLRRNVLSGMRLIPVFSDSLVMAHEVGHLFGAEHDREHMEGSQAFPYSHGHRFKAGGVTYTTIMAYEPGVPVPYFSNPNLTFDGVPLGVPAGEPQQADNAQTINRLAPFVAAYRNAWSRIGFASASYEVGEGDGSITVKLLRRGDLSTPTRVMVSVDPAGTATPNLDYVRFPNTPVLFAAGQDSAEIRLEILQDELVEGDETIRLRLSGVQGEHGLDEISHTVITIRDDEDAFMISPAEAALAENAGEAVFTVEFTGNLPPGVSRELELVVELEGSAAPSEAGIQIAPLRLVFTAEDRRQSFTARAIVNTLPEPDRVIRIRAENALARVRILDDDRPGAFAGTARVNDLIGVVRALPDGRLMIAGDFTEIDGVRRTAVARLLPSGEVDSTFVPPELVASPVQERGMPPARINFLTPDSQGRWLAGGFIARADGKVQGNLIRLEENGALDSTFSIGTGFDGSVWDLAEQADGKLVAGGPFRHFNGEPYRGLIRLHENGEVDRSFRQEPGLTGWLAMAAVVRLLPDGKLLIGGFLENYNGKTVRNIMRLHPDGTLDESFALHNGASGGVFTAAILPDGRAYIGGFFDAIGGRPFGRLARLNPDGSVDTGFRPSPPPNGAVHSIHPLPNGQVFVGGEFTSIGGVPRRFIALLNPDGSVDRELDLGKGSGDHVWAIAAAGDNTFYLGGLFRSFNEHSATSLARLRLPSITGSFTSPRPGPSGTIQARVIGLPGAQYRIESSADLLQWTPAGDITIQRLDHAADFEVPSEQRQRFFRLKLAR